ncbi:hypothetical protein LTR15_009777 [Elasticomyces elasticus]|nr:hypothetical protein LTR15_009777 [Elasticomyces elasticus]
MNDVERFIERARYTLKGGGLTPLQIDEIDRALVKHRAAQGDNADLQRQREHIDTHWASLSSTLARRGFKVQLLTLFAYSFAGRLLEQYWSLEPQLRLVAMQHYVKAMGTPEQRQEAAKVLTEGDPGARLDLLYEKTVGFAVTELLLERAYVDTRFRDVALCKNLTRNLYATGEHVALIQLV